MTDLKLCPFCGAPGVLEHFGGVKSTYRIVRCSKCRCDMSFYPTAEMAIDKWNTRAHDSEEQPA